MKIHNSLTLTFIISFPQKKKKPFIFPEDKFKNHHIKEWWLICIGKLFISINLKGKKVANLKIYGNEEKCIEDLEKK